MNPRKGCAWLCHTHLVCHNHDADHVTQLLSGDLCVLVKTENRSETRASKRPPVIVVDEAFLRRLLLLV